MIALGHYADEFAAFVTPGLTRGPASSSDSEQGSGTPVQGRGDEKGGIVKALVALFIAAWLTHHGRRWPHAAALALLLAAWAGTTLPDLDMTLGLGHRSGLTHSVLPLAACARRRWWALAAGLALGLGLHLSADLFPNAMRGFATVKLPGVGSIGPDWSYLWFAANAALALMIGAWLAFKIATPGVAAALLTGVALLGIAYLYRTDGGWWALALFAGLAWLATRGRHAGQSRGSGPP